MSLELTKENILLNFPTWEKPLSEKEITDFLETPYQEEKRLWFPQWPKDLERITKKDGDKSKNPKYTTKKHIRQDIKIINDKLDWWLNHSQNSISNMDKIYTELTLEDLLIKKEELKNKLNNLGKKFNDNKLEKAKQRPISNFLQFNSAGFAKCPFHQEKTASFHKLPGKERGHCFGCGRTGDTIDVVMALNNCTISEALKII